MSAKKIANCAMCVALSVVTNLISVYKFPFGGSITLCSMLFMMLPAWLYGVRIGVLCGVIFGLLNFTISPYFMTVPQFLFDYIFAFGIMGLGGIVRNTKNGLIKGYLIAVIGRWIMATIAGLIWFSLGMTAWEGWSPLPYSMAYNAAYIFAEAFITVLLLFLPPVKNALERIKKTTGD